jgi:hypothetical protein
MGATFLKILMIEYLIIACAYAYQRDWARVTYFVGAIILSAGVLCMK